MGEKRKAEMPSPGLAATLSHPTLATPEASPRRVGEGLGVRGSFGCRFMAQFACISRCKLPMNLPSGSSRRQEAHSIPNASSGKKIRASLPRLLREIGVGFKAPMCVRNSEVEATHEPTFR